MEQGLGGPANETPLPPSTPSAGSRRGIGGAEGRLPQSQIPPGFQGSMFDWNGTGQIPNFIPGIGQTPNFMSGTGQIPSQMQGANQTLGLGCQRCCGA